MHLEAGQLVQGQTRLVGRQLGRALLALLHHVVGGGSVLHDAPEEPPRPRRQAQAVGVGHLAHLRAALALAPRGLGAAQALQEAVLAQGGQGLADRVLGAVQRAADVGVGRLQPPVRRSTRLAMRSSTSRATCPRGPFSRPRCLSTRS